MRQPENLMSRRRFLKVSAAATIAIQSLGFLNAAKATEQSSRTALITVFLSGGPPATETFTPCPRGTPQNFSGPFQPIQTRIPGVEFSEHWRELALRNDKFSLLRALDAGSADHGIAMQNAVQLGNRTIAEVVGSNGPRGSIPYAVMNPGSINPDLRDALRMSHSFYPLYDSDNRRFLAPQMGVVPDVPMFEVAEDGEVITAPLPVRREQPNIAERRSLLEALDTADIPSPLTRQIDELRETAFDLLAGGGKFFRALDLEDRDKRRYGNTVVGDMCLSAKRLVAAGARAVTVFDDRRYREWDVHGNLAENLRGTIPPMDAAVAALLDDIEQEQLDILVVMMGEFSRGPQMTDQLGTGRPHWPYGNTAILAGSRIEPGVYGRMNTRGAIIGEAVRQRQELGNTILAACGYRIEAQAPRAPILR